MENNNNIGYLLKKKIREKSISIRKFSELTNIDAATISRIINGKRRATPEHIKKFAEYLDFSSYELFESTGYCIKESESELNKATNCINSFFKTSDLYNQKFRIEDIEEELLKYGEYSKTIEGKEIIDNEFEKKIEKLGCIGPFIDKLKDLFDKFCQNSNSLKETALIGGALLYFIINVDIIPDYIFPIGYIDDAFVIEFVSNALKK